MNRFPSSVSRSHLGEGCEREAVPEWREIPGTNGNYFVSDQGQVWSRPRVNTDGGLLKLMRSSDGYFQVNLLVAGRQRARKVHQLVLEAFVEPRPRGAITRHLDGNRTNNHVGNLAWGTYSENLRDAVRHGTYRNQHSMKTECVNGHPFDEANTYIRPDGARKCRACRHASRTRRRHNTR